MAARPLPEYVRHILDERGTNGLIHEKKHDRTGVTLCDVRVYLVQRDPNSEERPTFREDGTMEPHVHRFYDEAWSLDHWFNHTVSNNYYVACPKCLAHVAKAVEEGMWDGTYPDPECEMCDVQFPYDEKDPNATMCAPCAQEAEEE